MRVGLGLLVWPSAFQAGALAFDSHYPLHYLKRMEILELNKKAKREIKSADLSEEAIQKMYDDLLAEYKAAFKATKKYTVKTNSLFKPMTLDDWTYY